MYSLIRGFLLLFARLSLVIDMEHFHSLGKLPYALCTHTPPTLAPGKLWLLSVTIDVLPFVQCHINGVVQCTFFCLGLLLLITFSSWFILLNVSVVRFCPMLCSIPYYGYTTTCLAIHLLMEFGLVPVFYCYQWSCCDHFCTNICKHLFSLLLLNIYFY